MATEVKEQNRTFVVCVEIDYYMSSQPASLYSSVQYYIFVAIEIHSANIQIEVFRSNENPYFLPFMYRHRVRSSIRNATNMCAVHESVTVVY